MLGMPWENEDGSTNVEGFLEAYAENDNVFWYADTGHVQNVIDDLIARHEALRGAVLAHREITPPGYDSKQICECGERFNTRREQALHRIAELDRVLDSEVG